MKAIIIINETHSMMDEQKSIIEERYQNYEFLKVPSHGWTLEEMKKIKSKIWEEFMYSSGEMNVVFVSPIPYLLKELGALGAVYTSFRVLVMHNDRREKKELPDGRIISVVAQTGWQLV